MGSGLSNLHFSGTIYLDNVIVFSAVRRFDDKMETDQHLAEIFQNVTSQLEIGKT
ncbi:MAG: hypothetical protein LAO21_19565 [Acidobacteriia bacterium]|nr:hypothetical protein [Terriglobia bacterium]